MRKEKGKSRELINWCKGKDLRILQSLSKPEEEWEFIQAFSDDFLGNLFLVSSLGRVYDCAKRELCRLYHDKKTGYVKVSLPQCPEGHCNYNIHRLVAQGFVANPDPEHKDVIHHIDSNSDNNEARNLLWVTTAEHGTLHSLKRNDLAQYCQLVAEMRQAQQIKKMPPLLPDTYEEMAVSEDNE